jgi:dienelactone hydrolase
MDFGWYGDADIAPAVAFLTATSDVAEGRIAVVGMSMGGEEAIGAAAAVPTIRAVVAEGATGRTGGDRLPLRPAGVGRWFSAVFYWVQDTTADLLSGASRPIELSSAVVAAAPRPMLLITGGTVAQERTAGRRLRDVAPDRVELWEVPGAGHTAGLATAPEEWERTVIEFLDRTVRR